MTSERVEILLTPSQISEAIEKLAKEIAASFEIFKAVYPDTKLALIGIRTGGDELMRRIVRTLRVDPRLNHAAILEGSLDITLYRDDAHQTLELAAPLLRATHVDFSIEGLYTVLIDDVLYTGRTVRAALEALNDFGRAASVKLAVLIDRGGKQLPIAPDFVGKTFNIDPSHQVDVVLEEPAVGRDKVVVYPR